jgi:oxygen-independent coproporphyrinogen-3 oxidase
MEPMSGVKAPAFPQERPMRDVDAGLIGRYAAPVPRYTSYPTAPHFSEAIGKEHYIARLEALAPASDLSLYVHIPFCHELCWYCGCNTKAAKRYDPVARYFKSLEQEIRTVSGLLPRRVRTTHVHWGGGSPNVLSASHVLELAELLGESFHVAGGAEIAVEIDPRSLSLPQVDAFARAGVNRVSFGVQDFAPAVQKAINRIQTFDMTRRAADLFRERGVSSINIDIVYGLPHQTMETAERTIEQVIELAPDRIAAFGYAHLPSRLKHQRLIDDSALPGPVARFELAELIARRFAQAGFVRVGLDHFAKPSDPLARQAVARNFQGYTTDKAGTLIGLGASAIGSIGDAFFQNATPAGDYIARVARDGIATARGFALAEDDRLRAFVIERLMCELTFPGREIDARFGHAGEVVKREAKALLDDDRDGLLEPTADGFRITERGRPFVRSVCARFDAYLRSSAGRHAAGV